MALGFELAKPFSIASAFTQLRQFRIITATALTPSACSPSRTSLQSELTFMSMTRGDLVAVVPANATPLNARPSDTRS